MAERQRVVELIQEAMRSGARQQQACDVLELSSRTYQRWIKAGVVSDGRITTKRSTPANKLSNDEHQQILEICNSPPYSQLPPYQIVPRLADQGIYLASESSFYRILKAANQLTHRGSINIKTRTNKVTSFTASQPNQVWSWDITYLPSRVIGQHYYLYMIEDIYSRKAVDCEVYDKEEGGHAAALLERSIWKEKCVKRQLVLH